MVKWIKITVDGVTYSVTNYLFDDVELNDETIEKCLRLINCTDSAVKYQIKLIAGGTILRIKPK